MIDVVAAIILAAGFLTLWLATALYSYFKIGELDRSVWGYSQDTIKSREYEEIEINVAERITRFLIVNKENAKKLELASFLYETIQISFLVFSVPSEFWNPTNEWAEFIIYFIRLFCLDLPISLMLPIFAIYLITLGLYLLLSIFYAYSKTADSFIMRQMNANLSVIASIDRNAPEIMNFFFHSMFLTFCRFTFKMLGCASDTPMDTGKFLIDEFFGDFTCWNQTDSIPFLLFCVALLIVMLIVSVMWANRKGVTLSAFPCTERFAVWMLLAKFMLCGVLVFFVTMPIIPIVVTLVTWVVMAIYVVRNVPYLSYGGQSMHYNTYLFGSIVLGVYFSICALLLNLFNHSQLGLLYFVGAIFVLVLTIMCVTMYMQRHKQEVFMLKNPAFARQLLLCMAYNDMTRQCTDYLVTNWCNDPALSKKVLKCIENDLNEYEQKSLLSFASVKVPFLEWWFKWEYNHPKPGFIHKIVQHRIYTNNKVPTLKDLCCYEIVKQDEMGWRASKVIPEDLKSYIEELSSPVGDFDPAEVINRSRLETTASLMDLYNNNNVV